MSFSFRSSDTKHDVPINKSKRTLKDFPDDVRDHILKYYKSFYDTSEDFIRWLSPKFELSRFTTAHAQTEIKMFGIVFMIDNDITEIFRIINEKGMVTRMSCQYNLQGYATFLFTSIGYQKFVLRLQQAAIKKVLHDYSNTLPKDAQLLLSIQDDDHPRYSESAYVREQIHDLVREIPSIRRFTTDRQGPATMAPYNLIMMNSGLFRNEVYFSNWIHWMFLPDQIARIVHEFQDVFSHEE